LKHIMIDYIFLYPECLTAPRYHAYLTSCSVYHRNDSNVFPAIYLYMIFNLNPHCTHLEAVYRAAPATIVTPQKIWRYVKSPPSKETSAPPIGLPVKPPTETNKKNVPFRTPISLMGDIWAINDGPRETKAPDENPYNTQNTIIGALPFAGSQRARTMMAEKVVVIIMTLNRPIRSAIIPGRIRPKILLSKLAPPVVSSPIRDAYEAALRIDRRYRERLVDMPFSWA
jgi:hypothetical protein